MQVADDLKAKDFFASRGGVCVYVTVRKRAVRVQFATPDAHGVVTDASREDAEEAIHIARAALRQHAQSLAPLFDRVARSLT